MIISDRRIKELAEKGMISPFVQSQVRRIRDKNGIPSNILSYGCSSRGYDIRISPEEVFAFQLNRRQLVRRFIGDCLWLLGLEELAQAIKPKPIDPLNFEPSNYLKRLTVYWDIVGPYVIAPANTVILGVARERIEVPRNVMVECHGKSTYARCGVIVFPTPAEPGFLGNLTLEGAIATPFDTIIRLDQGFTQLLFNEGDDCEVSYADRSGKYQDQPERVVFPKV